MRRVRKFLVLALVVFFFAGCGEMAKRRVKPVSFDFPAIEADWIRNGGPIEFEGQRWYPKDDIEILSDSEVFFLDRYQGVEFFVEKIDVRPYDRLYTKFGHNKFRMYKQRKSRD